MISIDGAALDLPYNSFDYALLTTGWFAVISFGYAIRYVKGKKSDLARAHLLLLAHIVGALLIFAWRIDQSPVALPLLLLQRVFVSSVTRSVKGIFCCESIVLGFAFSCFGHLTYLLR